MTTTAPTWIRKAAPKSSPYLASGSELRMPTTADNLRDLFFTTVERAVWAQNVTIFATIPESQAESRNDTRFQKMASMGHTVVLLGRSLDRHVSEDGSEPHRVPLRPDDPMWMEWNVIVCGPGLRSAFLAQAVDENAITSLQGFFRWTRVTDPALVEQSARSVMERCPHLRIRLPHFAPAQRLPATP